jgi:hypothetical protein
MDAHLRLLKASMVCRIHEAQVSKYDMVLLCEKLGVSLDGLDCKSSICEINEASTCAQFLLASHLIPRGICLLLIHHQNVSFNGRAPEIGLAGLVALGRDTMPPLPLLGQPSSRSMTDNALHLPTIVETLFYVTLGTILDLHRNCYNVKALFS